MDRRRSQAGFPEAPPQLGVRGFDVSIVTPVCFGSFFSLISAQVHENYPPSAGCQSE